LTKIKISERIVYVIFQQIFFGGREIAQERGEILPKVSPILYAKFWENSVGSKFHQNKMSPKLQHYLGETNVMSNTDKHKVISRVWDKQ